MKHKLNSKIVFFFTFLPFLVVPKLALGQNQKLMEENYLFSRTQLIELVTDSHLSSTLIDNQINQLSSKILREATLLALWDLSSEAEFSKEKLKTLWDERLLDQEKVNHQARARLLETYLLDKQVGELLLWASTLTQEDRKLAHLVFFHEANLLPPLLATLIKRTLEEIGPLSFLQQETSLNETLKKQLMEFKPDDFTGSQLYLFCRKNRLFPCRYLLKNIFGEWHTQNGEIWSLPALASSVNGFAQTRRNGDTPQGVHLIEGVMPFADQQISFGKFRRLILEFVPSSVEEQETFKLLPTSHQRLQWWQTASIARDVGRDLLRIHGTGKVNTNPLSTWFPFMRTNGCIASRENEYGGLSYQDQRFILNEMMRAQNLPLREDSEPLIRSVLYVVEIDNKNEPVSFAELIALLDI